MKSICYILLIALAIFTSGEGIGNDTSTTTQAPSNTTTKPTTSTAPEPTTSKTPAPITVSTTVAPITVSTTVAPITVVPTTTAPPHEKDGMWVVKDENNRVCLVAQMKIQLDIPYTNTSDKVVLAHVKVPGNATGSGTCNASDFTKPQTLMLTWGGPNGTSSMTFTFFANETDKTFWLSSMSAAVVANNKTFPNIKTLGQITLRNSTKHFVTPLSNSYNCQTLLNIEADESPDVANHTAYITLDHFQLEAFMNSTTHDFSSAIYCESDNSPDLVPILVGCSLVALVLIVLAVYLWGRRRSARGYLSM